MSHATRVIPGDQSRCGRCFMRRELCICALVTPVQTRTEFLVIRHAKETDRTSNTARIAALALARCAIRTFGKPHVRLEDARLTMAHTYVLYPDGPPGPPPADVERVVVLDGSWSQARHMLHRIPELRPLPRIALPPPARPLRRLRRPPLSEGMSTLEAMAHVVALLEGPEKAAPLFELHDEMVERVLWTRGLPGVSPGSRGTGRPGAAGGSGGGSAAGPARAP